MQKSDSSQKRPARDIQGRDPTFWEIVGKGVKTPVALIFVEIIKFVVVLAGLLIIYWFIKALGAAGYSEERLARFEVIHYYESLIVSIIFVFELLIKVLVHTAAQELK
jgi:hypothetical protein